MTAPPWLDEPPIDDDPWGSPHVTPLDSQGTGTEPAKSLRTELLNRDQLADLPTPEPLIDGVLTRHAYAILAGRWGTAKSFIGLDWAACVATGKPWQGHPVDQGPVLYIAAEGAYGLNARLSAWEQAWGRTIASEHLDVLPRAVNLFRGGTETAELIEIIRSRPYLFVVVDTLNRNSAGADSNGTQDMGQVIASIDKMRHATGNGTVLVIAHTDAMDTKTRGSTSIEDDADIIYRTRAGDDGLFRLWRSKNKDGPEQDEHHLRLSVITTNAGSSCILESATAADSSADLSGNDNKILDALKTTFAETGATVAQLIDVTGLSSSSAYLAIGRLAGISHIHNIGTNKRAHWKSSQSSATETLKHAQIPASPAQFQPDSNPGSKFHSSPGGYKPWTAGIPMDSDPPGSQW